MRPSDLDLLHPRPPRPVLAWLLLGLGIGLCVLVVQQIRHVDAALSQIPLASPHKTTVYRTATPSGPDALAWNTLLARLESVHADDIALISLDADATGQVTLTAEAAEPQAMLDYLQRLRSHAGFTTAALLNHTTQQQQAGTPLRFVIRLQWERHGGQA